MPVSGKKIKKVTIQLPEETYRQLEQLAANTSRTVPGYVRFLIHQDLSKKGLPVFIKP